jgi:formimidoylglutamate deiminase
MFDASVAAYAEMRDAGITTVGEFHYLHHERDGDYALDESVLSAAGHVGIRLVLLQTAYASSGFGRPLEPSQRRFDTGAATKYWERVDELASALGPAQHLGVAGHSVRAVPLDELAELRAEASRRGLVFHLHLEEQPAEIEQCLAALGHTPMRGVLDRLAPLDGVTAVHCTHSRGVELAAFMKGGGRVCICPTTEANLGDGLPAVPAGAAQRGAICLGTDSNARIGMTEEMRWLELGQRLRTLGRGVLADERGEVAAVLMRCATEAGAAALGVPAGSIAPGLAADFALLDLTHPAMASVDEADLEAAWIFGAPDEVVCATAVLGKWRPRKGSLAVGETSRG